MLIQADMRDEKLNKPAENDWYNIYIYLNLAVSSIVNSNWLVNNCIAQNIFAGTADLSKD